MEIDEEQKQLISHMRNSASSYSTDYYVYDEGRKLQRIRYEHEDYDKLIKSIYALQSGEMKLSTEEVLAPMKR